MTECCSCLVSTVKWVKQQVSSCFYPQIDDDDSRQRLISREKIPKFTISSIFSSHLRTWLIDDQKIFLYKDWSMLFYHIYDLRKRVFYGGKIKSKSEPGYTGYLQALQKKSYRVVIDPNGAPHFGCNEEFKLPHGRNCTLIDGDEETFCSKKIEGKDDKRKFNAKFLVLTDEDGFSSTFILFKKWEKKEKNSGKGVVPSNKAEYIRSVAIYVNMLYIEWSDKFIQSTSPLSDSADIASKFSSLKTVILMSKTDIYEKISANLAESKELDRDTVRVLGKEVFVTRHLFTTSALSLLEFPLFSELSETHDYCEKVTQQFFEKKTLNEPIRFRSLTLEPFADTMPEPSSALSININVIKDDLENGRAVEGYSNDTIRLIREAESEDVFIKMIEGLKEKCQLDLERSSGFSKPSLGSDIIRFGDRKIASVGDEYQRRAKRRESLYFLRKKTSTLSIQVRSQMDSRINLRSFGYQPQVVAVSFIAYNTCMKGGKHTSIVFEEISGSKYFFHRAHLTDRGVVLVTNESQEALKEKTAYSNTWTIETSDMLRRLDSVFAEIRAESIIGSLKPVVYGGVLSHEKVNCVAWAIRNLRNIGIEPDIPRRYMMCGSKSPNLYLYPSKK